MIWLISYGIANHKTILKLNMVWPMNTDSMKVSNRKFRPTITNILHFSLRMHVYSINKLNWVKTIVPLEIFYVMVTITNFSMNGKIWHTTKPSTFAVDEMLLFVSTFFKKIFMNRILLYPSFIWVAQRIFLIC